MGKKGHSVAAAAVIESEVSLSFHFSGTERKDLGKSKEKVAFADASESHHWYR